MTLMARLPGPVVEYWEWQGEAACRGVGSRLFFHPAGERGSRRAARDEAAKRVCARCPVRRPCLQFALAVREPYGVWGGMTQKERRARLRSASPAVP